MTTHVVWRHGTEFVIEKVFCGGYKTGNVGYSRILGCYVQEYVPRCDYWRIRVNGRHIDTALTKKTAIARCEHYGRLRLSGRSLAPS